MLKDLKVSAEREHSTEVVVDCAGVRSVSYSFADEFIGALMSDVQDGVLAFSVVIENASPDVERIVRRSLRNRGSSLVALPA